MADRGERTQKIDRKIRKRVSWVGEGYLVIAQQHVGVSVLAHVARVQCRQQSGELACLQELLCVAGTCGKRRERCEAKEQVESGTGI